MSTETTKARITIDNGTNFGRVYTDKTVDTKISAVKSTADTANATANSASSTANAAKTTAETAKSTADACVKTVNIVSSQSPAGYSFNLASADGKTTVGTILFDASLRPTISSDNPHVLRVSCPYTITFED